MTAGPTDALLSDFERDLARANGAFKAPIFGDPARMFDRLRAQENARLRRCHASAGPDAALDDDDRHDRDHDGDDACNHPTCGRAN